MEEREVWVRDEVESELFRDLEGRESREGRKLGEEGN